MQASHPLISVIITCYNYSSYVVECIDSALSQSYPNMEVIVVDDGSTDNSWEKIQEFGSRVISLRTKNNGSLTACMTGLSLSKGDFVYFLDADDVLSEGALIAIASHLQPDVSKIQFMLSPIDKDGNLIAPPFPRLSAADSSASLIESIRVRGTYDTPPTSGNIYRRDVYDNLGELGYELAIDGVPYLLAPFVGRVVSIDRPLGKYRIHNTNLSGFSSPSAARMHDYVDRFMGRLNHLAELVRERCTNAESIRIRDDYAYIMELNVMSDVLDGRRPRSGNLGKYIRAVWRENSGAKKIALTLFGVSIFVLPNTLAREFTLLRLNPSRSNRLRSNIKRVFSI